MYSHTHMYLRRFLFSFFFSCIKGEDNEGDSMANVWMIKNLPTSLGPHPQIRFKTQVLLVHT
jgi:hypothetical protein